MSKYKGFDVGNRNKLDKLKGLYANPYGYNFDREDIFANKEISVMKTNQDAIKNKEYYGK